MVKASPWRSFAPIIMKEPKADPSQELDAGWDDIASDVTELAATPAGSDDPVAVEELDSGWDLNEQSSTSAANRRNDSGDKVRNRSSGPRQPADESVVAPTPVPSKKARRELERQNRMHAAKRRAEAKVQRKQEHRSHRQQGVGAQSAPPTNAELGAASHQATIAKRKGGAKVKNSVRPARISASERAPQPTHKPRIAGPTTTRPIERPASVEAKTLAAHETTPGASGKLLWVALSVVVAGIMAIIAKWLF
jgi:hypothetical protein